MCYLDMQELYGDLYTEKNVALSGIHTHSGPGGYLQYILYIITSLGFVRESFDVLVAGIVQVRHSRQPSLLLPVFKYAALPARAGYTQCPWVMGRGSTYSHAESSGPPGRCAQNPMRISFQTCNEVPGQCMMLLV